MFGDVSLETLAVWGAGITAAIAIIAPKAINYLKTHFGIDFAGMGVRLSSIDNKLDKLDELDALGTRIDKLEGGQKDCKDIANKIDDIHRRGHGMREIFDHIKNIELRGQCLPDMSEKLGRWDMSNDYLEKSIRALDNSISLLAKTINEQLTVQKEITRCLDGQAVILKKWEEEYIRQQGRLEATRTKSSRDAT